MCGIAGIYTLDKSFLPEETQKIVHRMNNALIHRGPDDSGEFLSDNGCIALAHRRLSIIDLSLAGHQPMTDEKERYRVTYNGEIYNYQDLKAEEIRKGATFRSSSDTEVILALYARHGLQCLKMFRGMFAFALWDKSKDQLLLARDHFGIKPLYYYVTDKFFLFASEIRALLASGLVPRKLNLEGLFSYLHYGSVQAPLTIIEGVGSLKPGHYILLEPGEGPIQVKEVLYTKNDILDPTNDSGLNRTEAIKKLQSILEESVHRHLVSDVPVGIFLSGGIDSSALVALMNRVSDKRPKTFTVTFAERKYSEGVYAQLIAKKYNSEHHQIFLEEKELVDAIPEVFLAMDQPTVDGLNTFVISKAVKEAGIKVALSGLGGDELFGGYPSFKRAKQLESIARFPMFLRMILARTGQAFYSGSVQQRKFWEFFGSDGSPQSAYSISRELFAPVELSKILNKLFPKAGAANIGTSPGGDQDLINKISLFELYGYMTNTLLRDTDCMSMAHGLEVRVPFVDSAVIQYILSLPGKWKIESHRPKPMLLDVMGDMLPEEIWKRPKMGFTLPIDQWMRSLLVNDIDQVLNNKSALGKMGINCEPIQTIWQTFKNEPLKEKWSRPWAIFVLMKWCNLNSVYL